MITKSLHIVSFSIPFPANYGGAIDVFYKLKKLNENGVKVILHCFQYDRKKKEELEKFATQVFYYPRNLSPINLFKRSPFIINSRSNHALTERLLEDEHPILLEGLHCCALLDDLRFKNRKIIVRSHNIEHDYYQHLALVETNFLKKIYFKLEAKKLNTAEHHYYPKVSQILGISDKDTTYFQKEYQKGITVGAFHQFETVKVQSNISDFAFYHGNLSVGENNEAALYLVKEVFSKVNFKLIIAGSDPSPELFSACQVANNVELKANLSSEEIINLLENAQINILPTFQSTGVKLKLIAALFRGKHCIVNHKMVKGTGLEDLCHIGNKAEELIKLVEELKDVPIAPEVISERQTALYAFDNHQNALKIIELL